MRTKLWKAGLLLSALASVLSLAARADDGGGDADLTGVVQALPSGSLVGDWTVAGKTVHVTASTEVDTEDGTPAVGAVVEVKGAAEADGSIDASKVEVKSGAPGGGEPQEAKIVGTIDALPAGTLVGDWTVGGKTVHVATTTKLEAEGGTFAVGEMVEVEGALEGDGSIDATQISLESEAEGDGNDVEVRGAIEALPAGGLVGDWTVGGKTLHVSATTAIGTEHGAAVVGAVAEAHGKLESDGSVDATRIEIVQSPQAGDHGEPAAAELKGTVEALAATPGFVGDWTVSGVTVHVTDATRIDQEDATLDVGALVEVKGTKRADASIDARRIEVESSGAAPTTSVANTFFVPALAHSAGKNGSVYTTDLVISNTGAVDASIDLLFLGHDRDGRNGPSAALTVAAGTSVTIHDVLGSLFSIDNGFGALRITSTVATLVVEASTSTPGGGGTFGQGHAAIARNELGTSGRARSLTGARADGTFRTNLMVVNATERTLDLDAALVSDAGAVLGSTRLHLAPLEMRQIDDAPHALGASGGVASARILLSTPTPGGAFAAAATVIDNRTNDPRVLSAR